MAGNAALARTLTAYPYTRPASISNLDNPYDAFPSSQPVIDRVLVSSSSPMPSLSQSQPGLLSIPLAKFSHETRSPDAKQPQWVHESQRDNLFHVIQHYDVPLSYRREQNYMMSVFAGSVMLEKVDLLDVVKKIEQFNEVSQGMALDVSKLERPVQIIAKYPAIAMRYPLSKQIRRIHMRYKTQEDYNTVLRILEHLQLPVELRSEATSLSQTPILMPAPPSITLPSVGTWDSSSVTAVPSSPPRFAAVSKLVDRTIFEAPETHKSVEHVASQILDDRITHSNVGLSAKCSFQDNIHVGTAEQPMKIGPSLFDPLRTKPTTLHPTGATRTVTGQGRRGSTLSSVCATQQESHPVSRLQSIVPKMNNQSSSNNLESLTEGEVIRSDMLLSGHDRPVARRKSIPLRDEGSDPAIHKVSLDEIMPPKRILPFPNPDKEKELEAVLTVKPAKRKATGGATVEPKPKKTAKPRAPAKRATKAKTTSMVDASTQTQTMSGRDHTVALQLVPTNSRIAQQAEEVVSKETQNILLTGVTENDSRSRSRSALQSQLQRKELWITAEWKSKPDTERLLALNELLYECFERDRVLELCEEMGEILREG